MKHTTFTTHFSFCFAYPQHIEHQWKSRPYAFSKNILKIKAVLESWPSRDTFRKVRWLDHTFFSGALQSNISNTCAKHIEDCKVGATNLIPQNFELNRLYIGEPPASTDSSVYAPSSKTESDDFDCGAVIDRNDQRAQLSRTDSSTATQ